MCSYAHHCAKRFLVYLYENDYLQDSFTISRSEAARIYKGEFNEKFQTRLTPYHIIFFVNKHAIQVTNNRTKFRLDENYILKLVDQKTAFDSVIELTRVISKSVLLKKPIIFKSELIDGQVVTETVCKACEIAFVNYDDCRYHLQESEHIFLANFGKAWTKRAFTYLRFTINNRTNLVRIKAQNGCETQFKLHIFNDSRYRHVIRKIQWLTCDETEFHAPFPINLRPQEAIDLNLKLAPMETGQLYFPILFTIQRKTSTSSKQINVALELNFEIHDRLCDNFTKRVVEARRIAPRIDKGLPLQLDAKNRDCARIRLEKYLAPKELTLILDSGLKETKSTSEVEKIKLQEVRTLLNAEDKTKCLTPDNYYELLDLLLHMEEHQIAKDIRNYDQNSQSLRFVREGLLELDVPGLAEHRPSLIKGDSVFIKERSSNLVLYEGIVHFIQEKSVLLSFSEHFLRSVFVPGKLFHVSFSYNRFHLKVEHQAVKFAQFHEIAPVFFPRITEQESNDDLLIKKPLSWFNRAIETNVEQQTAVLHILNKTAYPCPYLVYGPPGTGKTVTVVEAVRQIHHLTESKILVCTPSNGAANEIAKRLQFLPTTEMVRYVSMSYPFTEIPEEIRKFVNYERDEFYFFDAQKFQSYRIVVVTLSTASRILNAGVTSSTFDYVIIDESGQATETETLIPVAGIVSSGHTKGQIKAQLVLVGDPKQLGPILHSFLAIEHGFGISMMERLMNNFPIYQKDSVNQRYNPKYLTKLLKNYRSHPVIIKKPNEYFCDNELETCGESLQINMALGWEGLPSKQFPMIFHSVFGQDQRDPNSPSFYNSQEADIVKNYIEQLMGSKMMGTQITERHIGIIAPYRGQVQKIEKICKLMELHQLSVGSVEQFQGQERLIIILSTVRSKPKFLKFDHKFHLGFLRNPKRFNVAITRAKALLIVIGNPNVLQKDRYWRGLIEYCQENNAIVGDQFSLEKIDVEKVEIGIGNLRLDDETNPEGGPNFARGIV